MSTTMKVEVEPRKRRSSARTSESALSPTRTTTRPALDRRTAQVVGPGVVGADDEEPVGRDPVDEGVEGGAVGLGGAVVVEVVGLDVGDQCGVRRVDEEGPVALVGLGDEQLAAAVVGVGAGLVEVAADGEGRVGAAVLEGDGQQRGRGGLAVGAGDRDDDAALHHRLERRRARHQPQPALGRGHHLGVVCRVRRSRPRPCRRRRGWRRRGPGRRVAPRARKASRVRDSLASLPVTVMPRASMMRAMPESPAPPMPTKCTVPSWSAGSSVSGTGTLIGAAPPRPPGPGRRASRRRRAGSGSPRRPTSWPAGRCR